MSSGEQGTGWFKGPVVEDIRRPGKRAVESPKGDNDRLRVDPISLLPKLPRDAQLESPKRDGSEPHASLKKKPAAEGSAKITGDCVLEVAPKHINPITGEPIKPPGGDYNKKKMGLWDDSRSEVNPISKLPVAAPSSPSHKRSSLNFSINGKFNPLTGEPL
eukprot:CAMPEP_0184656868 /NCGR_PEP_ID=MMETSP0308-20130426/16811_1 /TAXON_ID=38269 /ORGANISM="Gloeochaete witrockiana, Strain SAG 46.84" /LENGTH=160 /DNA_ID=CAMNT_0027094179 /DNA_START=193 /DNA_END=675 /DNA_ORIENTATION=-